MSGAILSRPVLRVQARAAGSLSLGTGERAGERGDGINRLLESRSV